MKVHISFSLNIIIKYCFIKHYILTFIALKYLESQNSFNYWFTWCQSCFHGGHAIHMMEWFENHDECPVSNCTCKCNILE